MLKYIGKRLLMLLPVILVTSFLIFWAMSLTGGDPARQIAGDRATEAEVEAIREEMGLNDPFLVRYGNYMKGMLTGDMGKSYVTNKDVFRTFMEKLPNTLMLGGAAVLIAIIVSLPLGIYTAIHQNTWKDTAGMVFALFGTSMPNFWLGLMLIILFSLKLHWLPSGGKNGFAITDYGFYCREMGEGEAHYLKWGDFAECSKPYIDGSLIKVDGTSVAYYTGDSNTRDELCSLYRKFRKYAKKFDWV